jgi:hypothetical protein
VICVAFNFHCSRFSLLHLFVLFAQRSVLVAASAVAVLSPAPALANHSKCTKQIRAQGYFIAEVDSDRGAHMIGLTP